MPVMMHGQTYYRTNEVCHIVGISRTTLFRWMKEDVVKEPKYRDRRGWRLFSEDEIKKLKDEADTVRKNGNSVIEGLAVNNLETVSPKVKEKAQIE